MPIDDPQFAKNETCESQQSGRLQRQRSERSGTERQSAQQRNPGYLLMPRLSGASLVGASGLSEGLAVGGSSGQPLS
jgi:hypothetical protein